MKALSFCLLIISAISSVYASDFTRIAGWGKTEEAALHNAFVKAIELEMGVMILSDRDTKKNIQVKNDIYAYSAGFVDNYKIVSSNPTSEGVSVIVDVKVSSSKIKNQILISNEKSKDINGNLAAVRYTTYRNTKDSADMLLEKAVLPFPRNSYDIELNNVDIKVGEHRHPSIDINYSITFNEKFISTLIDTLRLVDNTNSNVYTSRVIFDNWSYFPILDSKDTFFVEDSTSDNIFRKYINPRNVRVHISLNDDTRSLYSICSNTETFIKISNNKVTFLTGQTRHYNIRLNNPRISKILENVTNVKISTVHIKECNNEIVN